MQKWPIRGQQNGRSLSHCNTVILLPEASVENKQGDIIQMSQFQSNHQTLRQWKGERLEYRHNQRMTFESINFRFQLAYSDKMSPLRDLSPPAFYLLYWQPLICNIAKILNRHRRYLDPRSPGTQTRPLSVTIILITDQVPSLPAIFRSFMCQILLRPRTFIKYFCQ